MAYLDLLMSRGQLALLANRLLRLELARLRAEHGHAHDALRKLIFENASLRAEARSVREEMIHRRSARPTGPLYPPVCVSELFHAPKRNRR
jgi:hypothetical protein